MVFVKGHPKYGGKVKGTKNKETLAKEERRAIFDAEISEVFKDKIHAARPEYVLDQFLGKPVEKHEIVIEERPNADMLELASKLDDLQFRKGVSGGGVGSGSVGGEAPTQK
jgi:hypothetical protein